ncbi:MAG: T9SS type A sorting domain-containing protein [Chitinophagales bacterium]|nr:T9SS type A sorting domain-containing protein [Chitinophagales bacterium]
MRHLIILSIAVAIGCNCYSQYNKYWAFGDSAGLVFHDDGTITNFNSKMASFEATSTISDSLGNLLFYTNGINVWNRNFEIMPNGTELQVGGIVNLGSSITQGVTILSIPGIVNKYYIIYITSQWEPFENYGLEYAIVDMSLEGGLGDVTEKNIDLYQYPLTEKMQAVRHANGRDWWLLTRQAPTVSGEYDDLDFVRFLFTPEGIEGPFFQHYGPDTAWTDYNFGLGGEMIFSPLGDKLAYTAGENLDIYDFDRCTGEISNVKTIYNIDDLYMYGCAFSPDGNKLYIAKTTGKDRLYQYCFNCEEELALTKVMLYSIPISMEYDLGQIELAPNDKIYFSLVNESSESAFSDSNQNLCVINFPNEWGLECEIEISTVSLGSHRITGGLNNLPNYNLGALAGSECDTLTNVIQIIESNNISIYPNPANEYIVISGEINAGNIIKIYSADGRVVLHEKINTTNTKVDISMLPTGVYVIQISEDGWVKYSEKLFKE